MELAILDDVTSWNETDKGVEEHLRVARKIWQIFPPITLIFGTVGNVLSLTMLSCSSRFTGARLMFLLLIITNTLVLWISLLRQWMVYGLSLDDFRLSSSTACKLHAFTQSIITQLASLILATIAIERCFAVFNPDKAKTVITKMKVLIFFVSVFFILIVLHIHLLWTVEHIDLGEEKKGEFSACVTYDYQELIMLNSWPWLDVTIFALLPLLIMVTTHLCMVCVLVYRYCRLKWGSGDRTDHTRIKGFTTSCFAFVTWFMLTVLPITVILIKHHTADNEKITLTKKAQLFQLWSIFNNIFYLNHAFSIILLIACNRKFRSELFKLRSSRGEPQTPVNHVSSETDNPFY